MSDSEMRERILQAAILIFNRDGFHGATMRNIAKEASCSLPMMYYYYKNKNDLYEEIAINQFFKIIANLNSKLDFNEAPADLYTRVVMQRKNLDENEKAVLRITSKLWLGLEGTQELRQKVIDWEKNRVKNNRIILDKYISRDDDKQLFAEIFLGFLENTINKITFFDDDIEEHHLKDQLKFMLEKVGRF
jgi:AcrR family transcriptional regulator